MGQEESTLTDENMAPEALDSCTLEGLASYIKAGKAKRIVVMTGAGISTAAGIPDFRSPGTGLYSNLARLNLPYPEAVFDINYFKNKPEPFYVLAHELYPGKFRPTVTHSFIALLADKGLLHKCFTQNIDTLERVAGVPADKMIEAHGSFANQRCVDCKLQFPDDQMKKHVTDQTIPRCTNSRCGGLVKPDIVFFGEALPNSFFQAQPSVREADLAIVMGSSLTVYPFAALPGMVKAGVPRLLINKERAGGIGGWRDDVVVLEDCDETIRKLAKLCGWEADLMKKWEATAPIKQKGEKGWNRKEWEGEKEWETEEEEAPVTKDQDIEQKVDELTKEIDKTLKIAGEHKADVEAKTASIPAAGSKLVAPSVASDRIVGADGDSGLEHVFPHIKDKHNL